MGLNTFKPGLRCWLVQIEKSHEFIAGFFVCRNPKTHSVSNKDLTTIGSFLVYFQYLRICKQDPVLPIEFRNKIANSFSTVILHLNRIFAVLNKMKNLLYEENFILKHKEKVPEHKTMNKHL